MNPIVAEIPSGPVTQDDLARVENKLDEVISALRATLEVRTTQHVLSAKQARIFVNCKSATTFYRWLEKYAPFARTGNARYSRAKLEIGRQRELAGVHSVQLKTKATQ